jgi:hypothetical protein
LIGCAGGVAENYFDARGRDVQFLRHDLSKRCAQSRAEINMSTECNDALARRYAENGLDRRPRSPKDQQRAGTLE